MRKPSIPNTRIKVSPSYKDIAKMFETTDSAIYNIVNFKTYKNVV